jgi:hypothetical protein
LRSSRLGVMAPVYRIPIADRIYVIETFGNPAETGSG